MKKLKNHLLSILFFIVLQPIFTAQGNPVIVKIDSVSASNGAQVIVPIRVKNFQNIVAAQGSISFDPTVATYSAISQFGLTGMNISNFGLTQISSGKLVFSWSDANLTGQSLADSSVLFSIKFDIVGSAGQQTLISLTNSPTLIEFVNTAFTTVSVTSTSGKIVIPSSVQQTSLTLFADSLAGLSGSQVIMPIKVKQFNQMVSAQGTVTFNQNVVSFVGVEQIGLPGMTLSDFGTTQTANGKLMFSWSDATLNGQTLADSSTIFAIKYTLVGNAGQQTAVSFASSPVSIEFVNTSLNTVSVITKPGVIKITSTPVPSNLTLKIDSVNGVNGGQISIPVRVKDFINILSMQGSIVFDPTIASFVSVQQFGLVGMDANSFGTTLTSIGKLSFSWYDASLVGQTLADSTIIFSIKFNLIGSPGSHTSLSFSNSPVIIEFIHSNYNSIPANLINGNIQLFGNISILTNSLSSNSLCSGQTFTVPYTVTGTMGSGNTFTAQLSDANGSFNNPVDIGSLTSSVSASISATIPLNTTVGNTYRIRVISSDPSVLGSDNGSDIIIGSLPTKPALPTGSTLLCENNINTDYTTSGSAYAASYLWSLIPANAGFISGNSTTATVDWSNTYTGTAKIIVKGFNNCGNSFSSDTLVVIINPFPAKPSVPSGLNVMCENNTNTNYTSGSSGATSFLWSVYPSIAGIFTSTTNIGIMDWTDNFNGIAKISVKAVNNCGNSISSDTLTVTINPLPLKPSTATGSTTLCQASSSTNYTTGGSTYSTSYSWSLYPSSAGSITGTTTTASVTWNSAFSGTAKITVKGINSCGTGIVSDSLSVTINPLPLKPATAAGSTSLCQGSSATNYTTGGSTYATAYLWSITPSTAGSITGTTTTASVSWNASYSGTAKISVKGVNSCGNSSASDTLSIIVNPLPSKPTTPTGTTTLCQGTVSTTYSSTGSSNATSYLWSIFPSNAGTISGTTTSSTANWNTSFAGTVKISVIGINSCGNSVSSDSLTVTVNSIPLKPSTATGSTTLCQASSSTNYTTGGSTYATSYSWSLYPSSAGSITGTTTTASVTWNSAFSGTAKITVKGINSCGTGIVSDSLSVTINPLPLKPATAAGSTNLCQGSSATNYTTGGSTYATAYLWSITPSTAGSITGTTTTASVSWNASFNGTAKISLKGVNSCGNSSASDTLSIIVNPLPSKPTTPTGTTTLCQGTVSTTYSSTGSSNATSYLWSIFPSNAGTISGTTTSSTANWNTSFAGTVKISVIGINSCGNSVSSDSLTVTVNSIPLKPSTATGSTTLCQASSSTNYTTGGSTYATSYSWSLYPSSAGSITGTTTTASVTWNSAFSGTAKITVKGINSCGTGIVSDSLSVTINPLPLKPATAAGSTNLCQGSSATNYTTGGSTYATAYLWSITPSTAGSITGTTTTASVSWNASFNGTAKISLKGVNSCGNSSASDTLSIIVNPLPSKPTTPTGTTTLCQGTVSTTYSSTGSSNATSYLWSIFPSNAGTISGTTTSSTANWNTSYAGTVKISVIGINSCGNSVSSDSLTVTVSSIPLKPSTATGSTTLCQASSSTNYTTGGSTYATSYSWSLYPSSAGSITGTTTTASVTWNSAFSGTAKITVKGINSCGTGIVSDSLSVTINPLPLKPATAAGSTSLCQGSSSTNYTTGGSTYATAYLWSITPSTAGSITGTTTTASVSWNASYSGTAKISVKGVNSCGNSSASDTLSIIVNPLPSKPTTPTGTTTLCQGTVSTTYSSTGSSNATSYLWSIFPSNAGTISGTTTSSTANWNTSYAGTVKISVIGINSCGNSVSSDSLTVTINSVPLKPSIPTGPQNLSQNSPNTVYTSTGSMNATSYLWSIFPSNAATISGTSTSATFDWNNTFTGIAKISVIAINNCGNSLASDSLSVTITALPTADLINTTDSICPASSDTLKINLTGASPWSITYNNGSSNIIIPNIVSSPLNLIVTPTITTTYKLISVTDANWTVSLNDSAKVVIRSLPLAAFTKIINALSVNFTNTSIFATAYSWNFGDNSPVSNQVNPSHTYAAYGNYVVMLTATNICGSNNYQDTVKLSDVGISENINNVQFSIYPNPNKGIFDINIKGISEYFDLNLFNNLGQSVLSEKNIFPVNNEFKNHLDIKNLPKGVYILNLNTNSGIISRKIIIQ